MEIFLSLLIISSIASYQVSDKDFDNIRACSYYLTKSGSNQEFPTEVNACEINSISIAEKLFGKCNKSTSFKDMLFDENMTVITYDDGLLLWISDDIKRLFTFRITSDKYSMVLENGKEIKLGLTLDDFKVMFPKSYAQKSISSKWVYQNGKTNIVVFFSFLDNDKKEVLAASWMIFVFNNNTSQLEEFRSYVPG
jgi:hypothetical protein